MNKSLIVKNQEHLLRFLGAVERGKQLHPGPYTKIEWQRAINNEIMELLDEHCYECGNDNNCEGCYRLKFNPNLGYMKRYRDEVMDLAVVCYRTVQALDEILNGVGMHEDKES